VGICLLISRPTSFVASPGKGVLLYADFEYECDRFVSDIEILLYKAMEML
jgi:hypothetical protein